MSRYAHFFAHAALWVFVGAVAYFGRLPEAQALGFSQRTHPLAWLGATGVPNAMIFNLLVFAFTGLLAAAALWPLRGTLPARAAWSARIGAQLVMLSALAFAAQGLLPIDLDDLDGTTGGLHGMAWMAWLLMFSAGNALLAWGLRRVRGSSDRRIVFLAAQAIPLCALLGGIAMPIAIAQRLAFVLWFVWAIWISSRYARLRATA
jgi:hypothetical membrane protein